MSKWACHICAIRLTVSGASENPNLGDFPSSRKPIELHEFHVPQYAFCKYLHHFPTPIMPFARRIESSTSQVRNFSLIKSALLSPYFSGRAPSPIGTCRASCSGRAPWDAWTGGCVFLQIGSLIHLRYADSLTCLFLLEHEASLSLPKIRTFVSH